MVRLHASVNLCHYGGKIVTMLKLGPFMARDNVITRRHSSIIRKELPRKYVMKPGTVTLLKLCNILLFMKLAVSRH